VSYPLDKYDPPDKYQTVAERFLALTLDTIILSPISIADYFIWEKSDSIPIAGLLAWYLFARTSIIAYFVIMHGLLGQTLGKRLCEVKVFDVSETMLSFKQAVLRDVFPIIMLVVSLLHFCHFVSRH